jgi:hypothetical protein
LAVALTDGLGVVLMTVPLFQISFVPDLTQKYLTLETVLVVPTLVHLVPAIVADVKASRQQIEILLLKERWNMP